MRNFAGVPYLCIHQTIKKLFYPIITTAGNSHIIRYRVARKNKTKNEIKYSLETLPVLRSLVVFTVRVVMPNFWGQITVIAANVLLVVAKTRKINNKRTSKNQEKRFTKIIRTFIITKQHGRCIRTGSSNCAKPLPHHYYYYYFVRNSGGGCLISRWSENESLVELFGTQFWRGLKLTG